MVPVPPCLALCILYIIRKFCLFELTFYVPVNSYGHVGTLDFYPKCPTRLSASNITIQLIHKRLIHMNVLTWFGFPGQAQTRAVNQ